MFSFDLRFIGFDGLIINDVSSLFKYFHANNVNKLKNVSYILKKPFKERHKKTRQLAIFAGASPTIVAVEVLNF